MKIVAITGSGISAPSGIKTYREDANWDEYANGIAHAKQYGNHLPQLWKHWTALARQISDSTPNLAHQVLATSGATVITQNVDGLHTVAGSENVIELHGDMKTMRCLRCRQTMPVDLSTDSPTCFHCASSRVRVNTVLFGEALSRKKVKAAEHAILDSSLVLVIGTSGSVYPARGLVDLALENRIHTVLFDTKAWEDEHRFNDTIIGDCSVTLPTYLKTLDTKKPM